MGGIDLGFTTDIYINSSNGRTSNIVLQLPDHLQVLDFLDFHRVAAEVLGEGLEDQALGRRSFRF